MLADLFETLTSKVNFFKYLIVGIIFVLDDWWYTYENSRFYTWYSWCNVKLFRIPDIKNLFFKISFALTPTVPFQIILWATPFTDFQLILIHSEIRLSRILFCTFLLFTGLIYRCNEQFSLTFFKKWFLPFTSCSFQNSSNCLSHALYVQESGGPQILFSGNEMLKFFASSSVKGLGYILSSDYLMRSQNAPRSLWYRRSVLAPPLAAAFILNSEIMLISSKSQSFNC